MWASIEAFNIKKVAFVFVSPETNSTGIDTSCLQEIKTETLKTENAGILQLAAESAVHFVDCKLEIEEAFNRVLRLCA